MYLNYLRKQNLRLQHSLFYSLVLIQLLMSKRSVLLTTNQLKQVHLLIFRWVKVKKKMQILYCKKQQRRVIGACSKMYILCKVGWRSSNVSLKLLLKMVRIQSLDALFLLNHQVYLIWKSFPNQFYKTPSKLQMKRLKILNQISVVLSQSLMKHNLNVQSHTNYQNLKPYYLDSACIIH